MVRKTLLLFSLLCTVTASTLVNAQSRNLLQNADAAKGTQSWSTYGNAVVEKKANYSCFVVRPGGHFLAGKKTPKYLSGTTNKQDQQGVST